MSESESSTAQPQHQPKRGRRRWLSISLRTMLILTTIICLICGLYLNSVRTQRQAVAHLLENGATVMYGEDLSMGDPFGGDLWDDNADPFSSDPPEKPSLKKRLARLLGIDFVFPVTEVSIYDFSQSDLVAIGRLKSLNELRIRGAEAESLAPLSGLSHLESLIVEAPNLKNLDALADMRRLLYLRVTSQEPLNIEGLRSLQNLADVDFDGCRVIDLAPLANHAQLASLSLNGAQANDFVALSTLPNLQFLHLDGSSVKDLTFASALSNLQVLSIDDTDIMSLEPLAKLKKLRILTASQTSISDVTPLAHLTNLEHLNLDECDLTDIGPLARLSKLTEAKLAGEDIKNLDALANCVEMIDLKLKGFRSGDFGVLASMSKLNHLRLSNMPVRDLSPLQSLNLCTLEIHDAGHRDLLGLKEHKALYGLHVTNTKIDPSFITNMPRLTQLTLKNASIRSLDFLGKTNVNLETLDISDNPINSLNGIEHVANLQTLNANRTQISDLTPLAKSTRLWRLSINGTQVSDLKSIHGLGVAEIHARDTKIKNVAGDKFGSLRTLDLANTPLESLVAGSPLYVVNVSHTPEKTRNKLFDGNALGFASVHAAGHVFPENSQNAPADAKHQGNDPFGGWDLSTSFRVNVGPLRESETSDWQWAHETRGISCVCN